MIAQPEPIVAALRKSTSPPAVTEPSAFQLEL